VPTERALRVLLAGAKAACAPGGVLAEPEPHVLVGSPTPAGIEYRVRYWHRVTDLSPPKGRHAVTVSLLHHLARAGLMPSIPKQDTFIARMPARQLEHRHEDDRAKLLAGIDLFGRSLTADELRRLAHEMAPRLFPAGARLMRQGEPGSTMMVLAEGLLEVRLERDAAQSKIADIEPGAFVGEMSLLTGEPRSATIVAATEALVYEITREHLAPLLAERPEIGEAISDLVAARRLSTTEHLAAADAPAAPAEMRSFSSQILQKMRFFFRQALERHSAARG
jgi:CRP-like cAMP-binding protein